MRKYKCTLLICPLDHQRYYSLCVLPLKNNLLVYTGSLVKADRTLFDSFNIIYYLKASPAEMHLGFSKTKLTFFIYVLHLVFSVIQCWGSYWIVNTNIQKNITNYLSCFNSKAEHFLTTLLDFNSYIKRNMLSWWRAYLWKADKSLESWKFLYGYIRVSTAHSYY